MMIVFRNNGKKSYSVIMTSADMKFDPRGATTDSALVPAPVPAFALVTGQVGE